MFKVRQEVRERADTLSGPSIKQSDGIRNELRGIQLVAIPIKVKDRTHHELSNPQLHVVGKDGRPDVNVLLLPSKPLGIQAATPKVETEISVGSEFSSSRLAILLAVQLERIRQIAHQVRLSASLAAEQKHWHR